MNISELQLAIRKHALANAVKFNGKASPGSVISKIIAEFPEAKADMKTVSKEVNDILKHINELSLDVQMKELQEKFPEMLEKKEKEERNIFAFLNIQDGEKITTAFPPGPEKYPHIGHAKAAILNHMLAKKYNGKFILRMEDTNPNLVQSIFYDVIQEDLKWLGVEWNELTYASDHMELFYDMAVKAINENNAYVCFCGDEKIKLSRSDAVACECRMFSIEENIAHWKKLLDYKEGDSKPIVRLKIDLSHQNSTMRDPTIFRVISTTHARHGDKYKVWPNYDFQNSIMDGNFGVTHRLRSKEFELRNELQRYIQKILDIKQTKINEFARFELEGVDTSGRIIREKINSGTYLGWDDPRLATLVALKRRGFQPEAIKNFVINTGISKNESKLTWDDLIGQNKKIVDKAAKRFFMMHDYERVTIENAPHNIVKLKYHPDSDDEMENRTIETEKEFLLLKSDTKDFKNGEYYRLMDCLNFEKIDNILIFKSHDYESFKNEGSKIMHWLPAFGNIDIEILMNDCTTINAVAEHNIKKLKVGEIMQFERFGFCRLDSIEKKHGKEVYKFYFTHK